MKNKIHKYDFLIVGAGLIGSLAALALYKNNFQVLVIDKDKNIQTDKRTLAVNANSKDFFWTTDPGRFQKQHTTNKNRQTAQTHRQKSNSTTCPRRSALSSLACPALCPMVKTQKFSLGLKVTKFIPNRLG